MAMGCCCMSLSEMYYGKLEHESLALGQSLECCQEKNESFVCSLTFSMLPFGDSVDVSKYNYVLDFKEGSAHVRAQACTKCLLILLCSGGCMNCDMIWIISEFCQNNSAFCQR